MYSTGYTHTLAILSLPTFSLSINLKTASSLSAAVMGTERRSSLKLYYTQYKEREKRKEEELNLGAGLL